MPQLTWKRRLFIIFIVALAFGSGISLGWIGRGEYENYPVGGMPTTAMQMAAPIDTEAEPTATIAPTVGHPTSTAAPTQAKPTSTPTAMPTPKEEWEIECPPGDGRVKCSKIVVDESGEAARLYWVGPCLDPGTLILKKQISGQLYADLQDDEWDYKFIPNKCDRPADRPSRNYLLVRTFEGPGNYALIFEPIGVNVEYVEFFAWSNAPEAPTLTPTTVVTPSAEPDMPAGTFAETATPIPSWLKWVSPFVYSGVCVYSIQIDGNYYWPAQGADWSLWDTSPYGDGGYFVLAFDEVTGEIRWLVGDNSDPCIAGGQLAGVAGLQTYLAAIGREDLEIPPFPGVDD